MKQRDKKLLRLAEFMGLHNSLWSDSEVMPAIFKTFEARAKAEERERSAKVSYDKMSQEIAPFTPKIFSTITSTEGKWE